ncbi:MAG: site-specific DNA-methyltransferase [bacterium]|nr:site-specific DNA-methyltransferase [bacterium]
MNKAGTKSKRNSSNARFSSEELFDVHHGDARTLSKRLPDKCVDVTVTSPPYFDMKDYGVSNQIGFGQDYETYLNDLQKIFSEVFRATKDHGSLWIVIDSFRTNQEVIPLPFDLAAQLKPTGWVLRDVIIWKKERTLPWSHKGTTRKIFEYVMVFSKSSEPFQYYPDRHRDTSDLKRWWVRYPERYNPKGKSLEEIWCYDIPTQGSWGKSYVQHFCPLPSQLVSRIISLTSNPDDVVLDPFSGSGTVPAEAALLNRKYVGFELNKRYISMFHKYLQEQTKLRPLQTKSTPQDSVIENFEQTILDLRTLKFARLLYRALEKELELGISQIFARNLPTKITLPNKIIAAEFIVHGIKASKVNAAKEFLEKLCQKAPLSKFGIEQKITFINKLEELPNLYKTKKLYLYSRTNSHQYADTCKWKDLPNITHPLISTIEVSVEEPDD